MVPEGIFGYVVFYKIFVFGRATGKFTGINRGSAAFGKFCLLESFVGRIHLILKQYFVRRIVYNFKIALDAVLA